MWQKCRNPRRVGGLFPSLGKLGGALRRRERFEIAAPEPLGPHVGLPGLGRHVVQLEPLEDGLRDAASGLAEASV